MLDLINLYKKLNELTGKEEEIITSEDYDELIEVLEEKRKVIEEIDGLDMEEYIKDSDAPGKTYQELKGLITSIKELEDGNIARINEGFGEVKEKMQELYKGQQSKKGYQKAGNFREAKFIDKKL